jgi:hypothetical protein
MDSSNVIGTSRNNSILPNLSSKEQNSTIKRVKAFGCRVVSVIAKTFCKLGLMIYFKCKYSDSNLTPNDFEKIANDFHDFPKLVQRMIKVVYHKEIKYIPIHPFDLISACFNGKLKLKTSGKNLDEKINNAKLIPNKNNNIKLNSTEFGDALMYLKPNQLEKLLSLIIELINSNSLSANEIAGLFKISNSGIHPSLIEDIMYRLDVSSNIEKSPSLNNLKLVLDFICDLEISELDKAEAISSVNLKLLFTRKNPIGSRIFVSKCKYLLNFLTKTVHHQLKEKEAKDYLIQKLTASIIDATQDVYYKSIDLYTSSINFILDSDLFDVETIKLCLHNLCSIYLNKNLEANSMPFFLQTNSMLLKKTSTTNKLNVTDKINIALKSNPLKDTILKNANIEWIEWYTEQLLQFASTIENLNEKKQLFSIIEVLNYGGEINENTFNKYIALIEKDDNLKLEDKKAIVTMLKNEKSTIDNPILYADIKLRSLYRKSLQDNSGNNSKIQCAEAKNILNNLTNKQVVEVLSSQENGELIISLFLDKYMDDMKAGCLENDTVAYIITRVITDLYNKKKISKEDIRNICSLDAIINNPERKDVFCKKWEKYTDIEDKIIAVMDTICTNLSQSKIITEILEDELRKVFQITCQE